MGFTTDKPVGAGAYLDASLGVVFANRWGTRAGVRIAPGAGSWANLHAAVTHDSFLGRTALEAGVAEAQPFYICFDFGVGDRCAAPPVYRGPMVGVRHEFWLLGHWGVQMGVDGAWLDNKPYALFNLGAGWSP